MSDMTVKTYSGIALEFRAIGNGVLNPKADAWHKAADAIESAAARVAELEEALATRVAVAENDARDAERYRWLRSQFWADGGLCVIKDAKKYTRLGAYMPFEKLLDDELDAAILAAKGEGK